MTMKLEFKGQKIDPANDNCPVRTLLSRISNKWSLLVLISLSCNGTMRFNDIHSLIGIISQRMLTMTLRSLETQGVISRTVHSEAPPRTEYALTKSGVGLIGILSDIMDWCFMEWGNGGVTE